MFHVCTPCSLLAPLVEFTPTLPLDSAHGGKGREGEGEEKGEGEGEGEEKGEGEGEGE